MKSKILVLIALVICAIHSSAAYEYSVSDHGDWASTWPKQLDSLRARAHTFEGPMVLSQHFAIPFTSTKEFEAAWPYLLKVKSEGAPVFLLRGPNFFLGDAAAGVIVHSPPKDEKPDPVNSPVPIAGVENQRMRWMHGTYFDVIVDDKVITRKSVKMPKGALLIDQLGDKNAAHQR